MGKNYSSEQANQLINEALKIFVEGSTEMGYDDIVQNVLEYYVDKMRKEFTANFKNTALKFEKQFGEQISEMGKFILDSIINGSYADSIKIVASGKDSFSIEIDSRFAIAAAALEVGTTEIPPMRHWEKLQSWLENEGIGAIAGMIQNSIANSVQNKLDSLK